MNYELDYQNLIKENMSKTQSVLKRFLKGFISGAITAMALIAISVPQDFKQLKLILMSLVFAGIAGGINGLILAIQKWATWKE